MFDKYAAPGKPDQELLRAMLVELNRYRSGRSPFHALVNALDAGINSLSFSQPEFVEALTAQWFTLEIINSLALDEGGANPRPADSAAVEATLEKIEAMIRSGQQDDG